MVTTNNTPPSVTSKTTLLLSRDNPAMFHIFHKDRSSLFQYSDVVVKNVILTDDMLLQLTIIPSWHFENVQLHIHNTLMLLSRVKQVTMIGCSISGHVVEYGKSFHNCEALALVKMSGNFMLRDSLAKVNSLWLEDMVFSPEQHDIGAIAGPRNVLELTNCTAPDLTTLAPHTLVIRVTTRQQTYKLGRLPGVRRLILITSKNIVIKKLRIEDLGEQQDLEYLTICGDVEFGIQFTDPAIGPTQSIQKLTTLTNLELINVYSPKLCIHKLSLLRHISMVNSQVYTINNLPQLNYLSLRHCSRITIFGKGGSMVDMPLLPVVLNKDSESVIVENRLKKTVSDPKISPPSTSQVKPTNV